MARITKKVESTVHPVFGHDTEELQALRKLAKEVYKFLTEDDVEVENLEKQLAVVREVQKLTRKPN